VARGAGGRLAQGRPPPLSTSAGATRGRRAWHHSSVPPAHCAPGRRHGPRRPARPQHLHLGAGLSGVGAGRAGRADVRAAVRRRRVLSTAGRRRTARRGRLAATPGGAGDAPSRAAQASTRARDTLRALYPPSRAALGAVQALFTLVVTGAQLHCRRHRGCSSRSLLTCSAPLRSRAGCRGRSSRSLLLCSRAGHLGRSWRSPPLALAAAPLARRPPLRLVRWLPRAGSF
jgi:hypothetical protein